MRCLSGETLGVPNTSVEFVEFVFGEALNL